MKQQPTKTRIIVKRGSAVAKAVSSYQARQMAFKAAVQENGPKKHGAKDDASAL